MKKAPVLIGLTSLLMAHAHASSPTMTIYGTFDNQAPKDLPPKLEIKPSASGLSIYGTIDAGIRNVTNASAAGSRLSLSSNGQYYNNRFGIKGEEDIGGGMNAHFHLEMGFNSGTGELDNTENRLFNRISSVGIAGEFGSLDFGRQPSVACKVVHAYDPFSYRYVQLIPLAGAVAGNGNVGDRPFGNLGGTRFSNAAQYIGKFGNVTTMAEYSFGEVSGSTKANSAKAIGFVYRSGSFALGSAYTKQQPNVANTVPAEHADQDQLTFGAAYKSGAWRIAGGHIGANSEATKTGLRQANNDWIGGSYDLNNSVSITAALYKTRLTFVGGAIAGQDLFIVGTTYALSSRTNLYASTDRANKSGLASPILGKTIRQTGISFGINHMF